MSKPDWLKNWKRHPLRPNLTEHPAYKCWKAMNERCRSKNRSDYERYGGRGITICERWKSFSNFLADMAPRPPGTSLDRIDNNGNYCPENCRWATPTEQAENRRITVSAEINGITKPVTAWARESGLPVSMIFQRVKRGVTGPALLAASRYSSRKSIKASP